MSNAMVMYEEEFNQIQVIVDNLVQAANSKVVFIIDKNGQLIAAAGETEHIDTTSLASLTAGNIRRRAASPSCCARTSSLLSSTRARRRTSTSSSSAIASSWW